VEVVGAVAYRLFHPLQIGGIPGKSVPKPNRNPNKHAPLKTLQQNGGRLKLNDEPLSFWIAAGSAPPRSAVTAAWSGSGKHDHIVATYKGSHVSSARR
jgi:hypothetical protein